MIRALLGHLHNTEIWSNYRLRIPTGFYLLTLLGIAGVISSFWLRAALQTVLANITLGLGVLLILPVIPVGLFVRWMRNLRTSVRSQMLDAIPWRGNEIVLDVGCGSGMLLNGAALRLTSGKAVGIDIWAPDSGSGNVDMLWKNARVEGVANRIEFKEADARQMPFEDEMFDVILSSGAVHHIGHDPAGHEKAVNEMIRVLKPGGQIVLWDVADPMKASAAKMQQAGISSEIRETERFLNYDTSIVIGRKAD